jgi:hypothetical protein
MTESLPAWWPKWLEVATELIVDKHPPDPEKDIPYFEKLFANNPKKVPEVVFQEATNYLLGHRADGGRKYVRARSFMANQFGKPWGGVKQADEIVRERAHSYLDRLMEEDARNMNGKGPVSIADVLSRD